MAKAPKTFQPVIATANALRSGDVVFRTSAGLWARDVRKAYVAATPEAAANLQTAAEADNGANLIVDLALIPIAQDGDRVRPAALRERIRADGPTISLPRDDVFGTASPDDAAAAAQDI